MRSRALAYPGQLLDPIIGKKKEKSYSISWRFKINRELPKGTTLISAIVYIHGMFISWPRGLPRVFSIFSQACCGYLEDNSKSCQTGWVSFLTNHISLRHRNNSWLPVSVFVVSVDYKRDQTRWDSWFSSSLRTTPDKEVKDGSNAELSCGRPSAPRNCWVHLCFWRRWVGDR